MRLKIVGMILSLVALCLFAGCAYVRDDAVYDFESMRVKNVQLERVVGAQKARIDELDDLRIKLISENSTLMALMQKNGIKVDIKSFPAFQMESTVDFPGDDENSTDVKIQSDEKSVDTNIDKGKEARESAERLRKMFEGRGKDKPEKKVGK